MTDDNQAGQAMGNEIDVYKMIWAGVVVIVSLLFCFNANIKGNPGFFLKLIGAAIATIPGYIGFLIGDFLRKLTIPDAIITSGGMGAILKEKLFWFCGPQLIGIIVGVVIGTGGFFNLIS